MFWNKLSDPSILGSLCWNAIVSGAASVADMLEDLIADCLSECHMNNLSVTDFGDFIWAIAKILVQFAVSHPNLTTTLVCNIDTMGAAHYPELCMVWLISEDKNYTKDPVTFNGTGSYRIIRINCPVDVDVYNSNNDLVASIQNNAPVGIDDSYMVSVLNEDGEKVVFLPIDEEYTVQLTATAEGTVNYNVTEYCANGASGATIACGGQNIGKWLNTKANDKTYKLIAVDYPTRKDGSTVRFSNAGVAFSQYGSAITTSYQHPELAAKYLDYLYTDDGHILANFGIEGEVLSGKIIIPYIPIKL